MTIPASQIVSINPGVIGAGGNPLSLNGLFLTQNALMPAGRVLSFASTSAVASFFGLASAEAALASIYFAGYDNSTAKPGAMLFAAYNLTARAAWLQGGNVAALTQAQWQAITAGTLTVVIDGYSRAATGLSFATLTSQSQVASAIATGLNTSLPAEATATLCTIAGTTLTVGGVLTGTWATGQTVVGSGVTNSPVITGQLTGSVPGGAGTYSLSATSAAVSTAEAMSGDATAVTVAWSSTLSAFTITSGITGAASSAAYATGTVATMLGFTSATGAVISAGAVADTPASAMNNAIALAQNWATFVTLWEPVLSDKINFAVWSSAQNSRYMGIIWDTDNQALISGATEPFGVVAQTAQYNGVMAISGDPNIAAFENTTLAALLLNHAAFVSGMVASINFGQRNGRITGAFKSQAGLLPGVGNLQLAQNLLANGYSYYGKYATANQGFVFLYNSNLPGEWLWLDTFIDQVWLNNQFQLALVELLVAVGAISYNEQGYGLVRAALLDPINAALNFGAIQTGVQLSAAQAAEVNAAAGLAIATQIQTQGYYLQVLDPGAQVRGQRKTPIINFWFTDGGAVQQISVASIDIL